MKFIELLAISNNIFVHGGNMSSFQQVNKQKYCVSNIEFCIPKQMENKILQTNLQVCKNR